MILPCRAQAIGLKTLLLSRAHVSTENTDLTWDGFLSFSRFSGHDDKAVTTELEGGYDKTKVKP